MKKQTYSSLESWKNDIRDRGGEVKPAPMPFFTSTAVATLDIDGSSEIFGEWSYVKESGWLFTTDPEPSSNIASKFSENLTDVQGRVAPQFASPVMLGGQRDALPLNYTERRYLVSDEEVVFPPVHENFKFSVEPVDEPPSVYVLNGYTSRKHYLSSLAEEHETDLELVYMLADVFGQEEDFDGLVEALKDLNGGV